jgi:hypothetical protein
MCFGERSAWLALIVCLACNAAHGSGDGFVAALGAEVDTEQAWSASAALDFAIREDTWIRASATHSSSSGALRDLDSWYADIELDHSFDPLGVRIGAGYGGDTDLLDSVDLRGSIYLRQPDYRVSVDFERRDFDFVFRTLLLPEGRTIEFSANGLGLNGRLRTGKRATVYAGGMWYDYSRNLRLQQDTDSLRFLSRSRIALTSSLLDHRWHAGVELEFGLKSLDFAFGRWQSAVEQRRVDSISVGFLMPMSHASDIEFRVAFDDSDDFGRSTVFSVFLYFFGGS